MIGLQPHQLNGRLSAKDLQDKAETLLFLEGKDTKVRVQITNAKSYNGKVWIKRRLIAISKYSPHLHNTIAHEVAHLISPPYRNGKRMAAHHSGFHETNDRLQKLAVQLWGKE